MNAPQPGDRRPARSASGWGDDEATGPRPVDLRALLLTVWRRKWVLILSFVAVMGLGYAYLRQQVPMYTATAQVMFGTREERVVNIDAVVAEMSGVVAQRQLQNEFGIITSFQLLERVVEKLRLDRDPEFNWALRPPSALSQWKADLRAALADGILGEWGLVEPRREGVADPMLAAENLRNGLVASLQGRLSVGAQPGSVIITISITSGDPRKAALIANTIADQYIVDQLEAKFAATSRASAWLSERLTELKDRVSESEAAVEGFKAEQSLDEGQGITATQAQLTQLNTELISARASRAEAQARFSRVEERLKTDGFSAAADVVSSPLILTLRQQRAELARREAELATRYGDRHPNMINVRAEIRDVNSAITSEVRKIIDGLGNDVEVAHARERALGESLAELEQKYSGLSQNSVQLRQLVREAEANRLIYENFLQRFKETSEQESLQTADARVLSSAKPPFGPSSPNRKKVLGLAAAGGLVLGFGLVLMLEMLANTFRSVSEVEARTGLPVLASIPSSGRRKRRLSVLNYVREKPNSALAEAIRNLRTALFLSRIDNPPKVVMVTSSVPSEGKSTTCLLLAHMSFQMGKRAVIVDCDIRRPTLHSTFGIADGADLISVLDGSATLEDTIRVDEATGLHILPAIRSAGQSADILSSQRFAALIETLRARYDLVLLDTPPTLLVSDAGVVGRHADVAVYAVRWDHTPRETAAEGLQTLRDLGIAVAGTVVTLVDRKREAQYSYARYGYGYGYYAGKNTYYLN
ncbi:MAG: polysaccharide biosynthesis tyrosine autokinase [Thermohalobaculum sp.]|nr:polysaccharide biosynthesis tyrosine autokinase [Thermohalobaculum sp.]